MNSPTKSHHELVAAEVRAHLARRRISGRGAARALGWKSDYIWRRLDGRTPLDVNDLVAIARLLDVPISALFAGLDGTSSNPLMSDLDKPIYAWPKAA